MENLINQFYEISKNNNEKEIKKFVNEPQNGNRISLVDYLSYTQNIDALKMIAKYVDFNFFDKFSYGLNELIKLSGVNLCKANENDYMEVLCNTLDNFKKNITDEEIKLFNAVIADDTNEVKKLLNNNNDLINTKYFNKTLFTTASICNCPNVCKMLLELGIDINYQENNDKTALMFAAEKGGADVVKELLKYENINVNLQGNDGWTALMRASLKGKTEVVKELLKHKDIEINLQGEVGQTALLSASLNGHVEIVKELLKYKDIQVNLCYYRNSRTALMNASRDGNIDIVKELLKHKDINVNLQNDNDDSALMIAVENGNIEIIKELLKHKDINVNLQDEYGKTALILAVKKGHINTVKELLKYENTDINLQDKYGRTALILAIENDNMEIVEELLKCENINLNLQDDNGDTALTCAARNGENEVVKELLKHKDINVNLQDENGNTALMIALLKDDIGIVEELLKYENIDVNLQNKDGETILMYAVKKGNIGIIEELLKYKDIQVNLQSEFGKTALMFASLRGNIEIVKELLKHKDIQVNLQSEYTGTALMLAAHNGHIEIVKELLKYKDILINLSNNIGWTALMVTAQNGNIDIIKELLRQEDIKINLQDANGKTALMNASGNGNIEVVKELLKYKDINVNLQDTDGKTALMVTAQNGHTNIVKELLEHRDINVNLQDGNGATALMLALGEGNIDIVRILIESGADISIVNKYGMDALSYALWKNKKNVVEYLIDYCLNYEQYKHSIYNFLSKNDLPINIEDISNANRDFVIRAIDIANADFGEITNSPFHGENIPMRNFIDFGIATSCVELAQEEENNLNNMVARFNGAIANRNQNEIKNSINDLFELCKTSKNIYDILDIIIDKNVIYQDNKKSLTKLLNFHGFDTKLFNIKLKTLQKFKEAYIYDNIKMSDGNKMSVFNKCFQLVYKMEFGEEIDALSQNIDINNAYLTYQQDKTENNKNNLINTIIHNMDNDTKKSIFEDLSDFKILDGNKKIANLEIAINAMTDSDLGSCLKNRLEKELQLNDLENINNELNNNQNQLQ